MPLTPELETETYLQNLQLKIDAMLRNDEGMLNLIEEKKIKYPND